MLRPKEIEIPETFPFQNCKLGREKYAKILTDIVSYYANEGCVLALNAEWGAGKTTFVKMWQQQLKNEGFSTLYFNAWECDYMTDPLIALLTELNELKGDQQDFQDIASNIGRIILAVGTSVGKQFIKYILGIDSEALDSVVHKISDLGEEALKEYKNQQGCLKQFRESLKKYVASAPGKTPIIFFIDELDRCNPAFAVRLLERVKHLFSIPNVVFVLSINGEQLELAIQGYYGSSLFNAKEYLRRFIDIEYNLPEPDLSSFCQYLYHQYGFDDFFKNEERNASRELQYESDSFLRIVKTIASPEQVSLRDIEQMFIFVRLALNGFAPSSKSIPDILFLLVYLKFTNNDLYHTIVSHKLSCKDLLDEIEKHVPRSRTLEEQDTNPRSFAFVIAHLIFLYNITENENHTENLFEKQTDSTKKVSILHPNLIPKEVFDEALNIYGNDFNNRIPLSYFVSRIELMSQLTKY